MTDKMGEPFLVRRYEPDDRAALQLMYEAFEPKGGAQGLPPREAAGIRHWLWTASWTRGSTWWSRWLGASSDTRC